MTKHVNSQIRDHNKKKQRQQKSQDHKTIVGQQQFSA